MRSTVVQLFCLLLSTTHCGAQEVTIYLNTNDCINCTSALAAIHSVRGSMQIHLICDKSQRHIIPAVLDRYGLNASDRFAVEYVSHRNSLKKAPTGSMVELTSKSKTHLRFPLKEFYSYVDRINLWGLSYQTVHELPIGRRLSLSDKAFYTSYADGIAATDNLTGKAFVITPTSTDSLSAHELTMSDREKRAFFTSIDLDTLRYDSFEVTMKKQGFDRPTISSANDGGDSLYVLWDIRYPEKNEQYGDMIQFYPAITAWRAGRHGAARFCDWRQLQPDSSYLMPIHLGFHVSDKTLWTPVHNYLKTDTVPKIGAAFSFVGNTIAFDSFMATQCPKEIAKSIMDRNMLPTAFFRSLFAIQSYPFLVESGSQREMDLRSILLPTAFEFHVNGVPQYWMHDALLLGNSDLIVLHEINGRWRVAWVDVEHMKLVRSMDLDVSRFKSNSMRLTSKGNIVGLSKDLDALISLD